MRILAFSVAHDSSVCVINNGEIEFFCKEERLSRKKRDGNPFKSLELYRSLGLGPIDHALFLTPSNHKDDKALAYFYSLYFQKVFNVTLENYSENNHHLSHASLAFYNSEFDKCLVFVIDRDGAIFSKENQILAREAHSVYECSYPDNFKPLHKSYYISDGMSYHKHRIKEALEIEYPNCYITANNEFSIVKVYEAATTLIGQHPLENGKTMGLSSYGNHIDERLFYKGNPLDYCFTMIDSPMGKVTAFSDHIDKIISNVDKNNFQFYADKAYQVQNETQNVVLDIIKYYTHHTGITNVCLVGGYGLNIIANSHYIKNLPNINFYFEPVADDTGISIGAAMHKYRTLSKDTKVNGLKTNCYHYYRPTEFNEGQFTTLDELVNLLTSQKSLAICDGNPEAGPRALGHRSILFDPRNEKAKTIVNEIKKREWYRPFAGVILKEYFPIYFETLGLEESPYMTINFDCKPITEKLVPGIVHVDKTCRIQTVDKTNGFLYTLLSEFYNKTGCPILLNTSFNLAGEPLVQTNQDALNTLYSSSLDAVYFVNDNRLVTKC